MALTSTDVRERIESILHLTDVDSSVVNIFHGRYGTVETLDNALYGIASVTLHPLVGLYQIAFNRTPDADGLAYWSGRLNGDSLVASSPDTIAQIVREFAGSEEWQQLYGNKTHTRVVEDLYQQALGRGSDADGFAYWLEQLEGGRSPADLVLEFSLSQEFITRSTPHIDSYLHDAQPTTGSLFALEPSGAAATGKLSYDLVEEHLTEILRIEPPQYLVDTFRTRYDSVSDLDRALLDIGAVSLTPLVGLYQVAFNRIPDAEGLDYWHDRATSGNIADIDLDKLKTIAKEFVASDEWQSKHGNSSPQEVVEAIYFQALNRRGEPAGVAFWTAQLGTGRPAADLLLEFILSEEFIVSTASNFDALLLSAAFGGFPKDATLFEIGNTDGSVIDGYLAGSFVFIDVNGNGLHEDGEYSTVTDAGGKFSIPDGILDLGDLVAQGGTDITTGHVVDEVFRAPSGSSVVTPLTTLVAALIDDGYTSAAAGDLVRTALGLTTDTDLKHLNPIAAALSYDPAAAAEGLAAQAASQKIATLIIQVNAALAGAAEHAGLKDVNLDGLVAAALAGAIIDADNGIDLSDPAFLQTIITQAVEALAEATEATPAQVIDLEIAVNAGELAVIVSNFNTLVDEAAASGTGARALTELAKLQSVVQDEAKEAIGNAARAGDTSGAADYADPDAVKEKADAAEIGDIAPGVPSTPEPEPAYEVAASASAVNEGDPIVFILTTINVAAGNVLDLEWSGTANADDFIIELPTSIQVGADGTASLWIIVREDGLTEGPEFITLAISGTRASSTVTINDTSLLPLTNLVDGTLTLLLEGNYSIEERGNDIVIIHGEQTESFSKSAVTTVAVSAGATLTVPGSNDFFGPGEGIAFDVDAAGKLLVDIAYAPLSQETPSLAALNLSRITTGEDSHAIKDLWQVVDTVGGGLADKFKLFWANGDARYYATSYDNAEANLANIDLSEIYAAYLLGEGAWEEPGSAITDIVQTKVSGTPNFEGRQQSLHDNLLGNLTDAAISDRFPGGDPRAEVGKAFGDRPYEDGQPPSAAVITAADRWDILHGIDRDADFPSQTLVNLTDGVAGPGIGGVSADWEVDRRALAEISTASDPDDASTQGTVIAFTIDPEKETVDHHRYQGAKLKDGDAANQKFEKYIDLAHGSTVEFKLFIDPTWRSDDAEQLTGVWIQLQNADKTLSSGGRYSIVEYIDPDAAAALEINISEDETFTGGFRFWNSDEGWAAYVNSDLTGWVTLNFSFTAEAHVWTVANEKLYSHSVGHTNSDDELADETITTTDIIETVIFNSQNYGAEQTYYYDDVKLTGISINDNFYESGIV